MRISPEVEIALSLAANEAARRRHEYVTLEHLLYALLFDEATAARRPPRRRRSGGHQEGARAVPRPSSSTASPRTRSRRPTASLGVQRAIRRADEPRAVERQGAGHGRERARRDLRRARLAGGEHPREERRHAARRRRVHLSRHLEARRGRGRRRRQGARVARRRGGGPALAQGPARRPTRST